MERDLVPHICFNSCNIILCWLPVTATYSISIHHAVVVQVQINKT